VTEYRCPQAYILPSKDQLLHAVVPLTSDTGLPAGVSGMPPRRKVTDGTSGCLPKLEFELPRVACIYCSNRGTTAKCTQLRLNSSADCSTSAMARSSVSSVCVGLIPASLVLLTKTLECRFLLTGGGVSSKRDPSSPY
jgi:hypothetical protein